MSDRKLIDIFIYPIKGMGSIRVQESEVLSAGLQYDRRWMLVDESGTFVSQRTSGVMAKFETQIDKKTLTVGFEGDTISIPISIDGVDKTRISIWKSKLSAFEASQEISSWFSERLSSPVRLVYKQDEIVRKRRFFVEPYLSPVSLADGYPLLVLGTGSLDNLNSKLDKPVLANRFRPNLIFETKGPHVEDDWSAFSLGGSQLKVINPCARCMVVNIDQKSGEQFKEPLKTLATYRKKRSKVMFGANTVVTKEGMISLGDEVILQEA